MVDDGTRSLRGIAATAVFRPQVNTKLKDVFGGVVRPQPRTADVTISLAQEGRPVLNAVTLQAGDLGRELVANLFIREHAASVMELCRNVPLE